MGFFSSLGKKLGSAAHSIGQKARGVAKKGRVFVHEHAGQIEKVARIVGDVSGFVGNVAVAALPFTAEIPFVGEVVAGLAAGGKAIEYGSRYVQKAAGTAKRAEAMLTTGESAYHHGESAMEAMRRGQLITAYKEGEAAVKEGEKLKKQIERKKK